MKKSNLTPEELKMYYYLYNKLLGKEKRTEYQRRYRAKLKKTKTT